MWKVLAIPLVLFFTFTALDNNNTAVGDETTDIRRYADDLDPDSPFSVKYEVVDQKLYVECVFTTFSDEDTILLFVDGKLVDKLSTPSFIVKNLSKGKHHIELKRVHNKSTKLPLVTSFEVLIG